MHHRKSPHTIHAFYIVFTIHDVNFFVQAEDGIRDHCVTGVQTCPLPISQKLSRFGYAFFSASRSLLAWSIAGEGMVNLGVPLVTTDFRNLKCSSMLGRVRRILPLSLNIGCCSWLCWNGCYLVKLRSTPSKT